MFLLFVVLTWLDVGDDVMMCYVSIKTASPMAKLAPVRPMQELAPTSSAAPAAITQPNQRITITLGKDSTGKGTVTSSGAASLKGLTKRGEKRMLAAGGGEDSSPPSTAAAHSSKRTKGGVDAVEKPTTRGKSATKPSPSRPVESVWLQNTGTSVTETLRSNSIRSMPHSLAAEHQTGVTTRYGFFGLASNGMLAAVAEKMGAANKVKFSHLAQ